MYPKSYMDYFRRFDRKKEVFVAMPFAKEFESRWRNIYKPAIESLKLTPYRVKERFVSDSILIDILKGIGRAKFILADISSQKSSKQSAGPNPNVMYELGIAHAMRLPEEVIVLRDNKEELEAPFDIKHIRWIQLNPNDIEVSRRKVCKLLKHAEREIELTQDLIVKTVLSSLDPDMVFFLNTLRSVAKKENGFDLAVFDPDRKGLYSLGLRDSSEIELREIARMLIELGVLECGEFWKLPKEWEKLKLPFKWIYGASQEYKLTLLGQTILAKIPSFDL